MYNSVAVRFYALLKIHKEVLSMPSIIFSIDCSNSKITQHVTDTLTVSDTKNNLYYVDSSFKFSEFIMLWVI